MSDTDVDVTKTLLEQTLLELAARLEFAEGLNDVLREANGRLWTLIASPPGTPESRLSTAESVSKTIETYQVRVTAYENLRVVVGEYLETPNQKNFDKLRKAFLGIPA